MDSRLGLCSGPCLFKSEYILLTAGPFWEKKEETSKWRLHSGSLWNSLWETVFSSWQFPEFIFGFYYTLCKQGLILLSHSLSTWLSISPPNFSSFFLSLVCQAFLRPLCPPQLQAVSPCAAFPWLCCSDPRSHLHCISVWIPIVHKLYLYSALVNLITVSWGTWTAAATENAAL